jgi:hypothetical protein
MALLLCRHPDSHARRRKMRTYESTRSTQSAENRCADRPPPDVEPKEGVPAHQPDEEPVPEEAGYGYGV